MPNNRESSITNPEKIGTPERAGEYDKKAAEAIKNLDARAQENDGEKTELIKKLDDVLKFDVSKKYEKVIGDVKTSKIEWVNSAELARRLKLKGAEDEDVAQVKDWLKDNATGATTYVLPLEKYNEVKKVLTEITGDQSLASGKAFHVPGGRTDLPDYAKNAIFIQENPPRLPIPGQTTKPSEYIDTNTLNHEMGHVVQSGLLESDLYKDWSPKFKPGAEDTEYFGSIEETDTRVRSMFRELTGSFDPQKEAFAQKHIDMLRAKQSGVQLSKDTNDLFDIYDDSEIIRLANELPAI